jgi:Ricin-type beta-trefoil lectin domain-like
MPGAGRFSMLRGASLADLTPVIQFQQHGGLNQRWRFLGGGDTFFIKSSASESSFTPTWLSVEGSSLDDGARIIQSSNEHPENRDGQIWKLVLASIFVFRQRGIRVKSLLTGLVWDVRGGSLEDGAPIIQFTDHGGLNQRWRFEESDGGFFKIISSASGKVLDVRDGSLEDGAPIIQSTDHGGPSQQWQLVAVIPDVREGLTGDRQIPFMLTNRLSGKVVSLGPGAAPTDANVRQFSKVNTGPFDTRDRNWILLEEPATQPPVLHPSLGENKQKSK